MGTTKDGPDLARESPRRSVAPVGRQRHARNRSRLTNGAAWLPENQISDYVKLAYGVALAAHRREANPKRRKENSGDE